MRVEGVPDAVVGENVRLTIAPSRHRPSLTVSTNAFFSRFRASQCPATPLQLHFRLSLISQLPRLRISAEDTEGVCVCVTFCFQEIETPRPDVTTAVQIFLSTYPQSISLSLVHHNNHLQDLQVRRTHIFLPSLAVRRSDCQT